MFFEYRVSSEQHVQSFMNGVRKGTPDAFLAMESVAQNHSKIVENAIKELASSESSPDAIAEKFTAEQDLPPNTVETLKKIINLVYYRGLATGDMESGFGDFLDESNAMRTLISCLGIKAKTPAYEYTHTNVFDPSKAPPHEEIIGTEQNFGTFKNFLDNTLSRLKESYSKVESKKEEIYKITLQFNRFMQNMFENRQVILFSHNEDERRNQYREIAYVVLGLLQENFKLDIKHQASHLKEVQAVEEEIDELKTGEEKEAAQRKLEVLHQIGSWPATLNMLNTLIARTDVESDLDRVCRGGLNQRINNAIQLYFQETESQETSSLSLFTLQTMCFYRRSLFNELVQPVYTNAPAAWEVHIPATLRYHYNLPMSLGYVEEEDSSYSRAKDDLKSTEAATMHLFRKYGQDINNMIAHLIGVVKDSHNKEWFIDAFVQIYSDICMDEPSLLFYQSTLDCKNYDKFQTLYEALIDKYDSTNSEEWLEEYESLVAQTLMAGLMPVAHCVTAYEEVEKKVFTGRLFSLLKTQSPQTFKSLPEDEQSNKVNSAIAEIDKDLVQKLRFLKCRSIDENKIEQLEEQIKQLKENIDSERAKKLESVKRPSTNENKGEQLELEKEIKEWMIYIHKEIAKKLNSIKYNSTDENKIEQLEEEIEFFDAKIDKELVKKLQSVRSLITDENKIEQLEKEIRSLEEEIERFKSSTDDLLVRRLQSVRSLITDENNTKQLEKEIEQLEKDKNQLKQLDKKTTTLLSDEQKKEDKKTICTALSQNLQDWKKRATQQHFLEYVWSEEQTVTRYGALLLLLVGKIVELPETVPVEGAKNRLVNFAFYLKKECNKNYKQQFKEPFIRAMFIADDPDLIKDESEEIRYSQKFIKTVIASSNCLKKSIRGFEGASWHVLSQFPQDAINSAIDIAIPALLELEEKELLREVKNIPFVQLAIQEPEVLKAILERLPSGRRQQIKINSFNEMKKILNSDFNFIYKIVTCTSSLRISSLLLIGSLLAITKARSFGDISCLFFYSILKFFQFSISLFLNFTYFFTRSFYYQI